MSDDSTFFESHLLNEEFIFKTKQEEFSCLIRGRQSNPSNLPGAELGTSLIPENVTEADNQLVALRSKPNGECLFNAICIILFEHETL